MAMGGRTAAAPWHWCTSWERRVSGRARATSFPLALFQNPARVRRPASGQPATAGEQAACAPSCSRTATRGQCAPAKARRPTWCSSTTLKSACKSSLCPPIIGGLHERGAARGQGGTPVPESAAPSARDAARARGPDRLIVTSYCWLKTPSWSKNCWRASFCACSSCQRRRGESGLPLCPRRRAAAPPRLHVLTSVIPLLPCST